MKSGLKSLDIVPVNTLPCGGPIESMVACNWEARFTALLGSLHHHYFFFFGLEIQMRGVGRIRAEHNAVMMLAV